MADINWRTGGLEHLIEGLHQSASRAIPNTSRVMRETTDRGTRIAKAEAPVDTGRLRSEIQGVATALTGSITSHAPYSGWVNGGTSRQSPNEYMGRTVDRLITDLPGDLADAVRLQL